MAINDSLSAPAARTLPDLTDAATRFPVRAGQPAPGVAVVPYSALDAPPAAWFARGGRALPRLSRSPSRFSR